MNTGTEVLSSDGSMPFVDFVGELTGGIPGQSTSEPSRPAGSPPADGAAPAAEATPKGTETPERPETPPADASDHPVPDAGTPTAQPADGESDPFASAKPFTYTVDGQAKTHDGIKVLETGDGWIDASHIADVARRLGERDHLVGVNQQQYRERQALEPLTTWKTTGPDGKEQTLVGAEGLHALHADHARLSAAVTIADAILGDPAKLLSLLAKDEKGNLVIDPAAVETLMMRAQLAADAAERTTRTRLGAAVQSASKPMAPAINYDAEAPRIIREAAGDKFATLTPEDQKALAIQMRFYHTAGTNRIDAAFSDIVRDKIAQREQLAKVVTSTTDAAKANVAKFAAAAKGKTAAPTAQVKPPTATQQRQSEADAAWDHQEKAAAAALRRRMA